VAGNDNVTRLGAGSAPDAVPSPRESEPSRTHTFVSSILTSGLTSQQKIEALTSFLGALAPGTGPSGPTGPGNPPPQRGSNPWLIGGLLVLTVLGAVGDAKDYIAPEPTPVVAAPSDTAIEDLSKQIAELAKKVGELGERIDDQRADQRDWNALVVEAVDDVAHQTGPDDIPDSVGYLIRLQKAQEKKHD